MYLWMQIGVTLVVVLVWTQVASLAVILGVVVLIYSCFPYLVVGMQDQIVLTG